VTVEAGTEVFEATATTTGEERDALFDRFKIPLMITVSWVLGTACCAVTFHEHSPGTPCWPPIWRSG
jgi:hypothetical protein